MGDQVVVQHLTTYENVPKPAYQVDVYAIERWSKGQSVHQDFLAVHRLTCDAPVTKSNRDVWPNPTHPGCSNLPPPTSAGSVNV
ncbi:hypothetical protein DWU98_05465 [Dyella monticola]|uniref:Uncharacterized protein n=1 Tax=Dyella monticola TaxID=1927958 RepID=A0A370X5R4_9GAMM|nr:hypothetical protein [Dyella monticola]RDS83764.1 hypothetical protein DWU98_05465 [Dyella monticola]